MTNKSVGFVRSNSQWLGAADDIHVRGLRKVERPVSLLVREYLVPQYHSVTVN